jgi:hypothetical protein
MQFLGCDGREDIRAYRVPKPPAATVVSAAPPPMNRSQARVVWTLPEGWKDVPSSKPMRVATIDAGGTEIAVSAFPGDAGGTLANVNRWRGQMGQPPTDEVGLAANLKSAKHATKTGNVEVATLLILGAGENSQAMLGAIITPGDGQTWFAKATTDPAAAAALTPAFERFAASFRLDHETPAAIPPTVAPIPSPIAPASPPSAITNPHAEGMDLIEPRLAAWTPPTHWKPESLAGGFVAASFAATNNDGGARITATSLLNDGGGVLANINRWREQLGLAPAADVSQLALADFGPGTTMVDLANPAGGDRMIAVIVPAAQATWFFKLRGAPKGVEAERSAFEKFVKGVGLGAGP